MIWVDGGRLGGPCPLASLAAGRRVGQACAGIWSGGVESTGGLPRVGSRIYRATQCSRGQRHSFLMNGSKASWTGINAASAAGTLA